MLTKTARGLALTLLGIAAASSLPAAAPPSADLPELEGTWTWTWKDGSGQTHRHVLEVEGKGKKLAAREIFDDQAPVKVDPLTLDGRSIRLTVVRGDRRADYTGKVTDADHIDGKVMVTAGAEANEFLWKAERRKDIPK